MKRLFRRSKPIGESTLDLSPRAVDWVRNKIAFWIRRVIVDCRRAVFAYESREREYRPQRRRPRQASNRSSILVEAER